jgi:hypothetical protein
MNIREYFRRRPWLWIVLFLGAMVVADMVLVAISLSHRPIPSK